MRCQSETKLWHASNPNRSLIEKVQPQMRATIGISAPTNATSNRSWVEESGSKTTSIHLQDVRVSLTNKPMKHTNQPHYETNPPTNETNQSTNQPTNQPINQSTNQPINQSTNQRINRSTDPPISRSTNQTINHPTDQSTDQLINQATNQPINWPTDQLRNHFFVFIRLVLFHLNVFFFFYVWADQKTEFWHGSNQNGSLIDGVQRQMRAIIRTSASTKRRTIEADWRELVSVVWVYSCAGFDIVFFGFVGSMGFTWCMTC